MNRSTKFLILLLGLILPIFLCLNATAGYWTIDKSNVTNYFRWLLERIHWFWDVNGVAVCTAINDQEMIDSIPDGTGGVIIAWTDKRNDTGDIYAQRMGPYGYPLWPKPLIPNKNGISVCSAENERTYPRLVPDGKGGAFIVWKDFRNGVPCIYMTKVNANGRKGWYLPSTSDSIGTINYIKEILITYTKTPVADNVNTFDAVSDGKGGVIIAWKDGRAAPTYNDSHFITDIYCNTQIPLSIF